ncbi:tryptophan--tRNA ligase [Ureaplasma diversum]|uniref:Tryptophan--tRNA ligase n=1 Tax=Ureaplasma diversum TaxID=42094 RepID=A0A0C5RPB2_9BACT|nr:tryptophan--tRNA ligase [Ureaplasma diversum]AJQ45284.1 tryptophan--tRNA ligase [Ureaplasma diversum]
MKRLVSGIQPTNNLTLGNYLGAIVNFVKLQEEYEVFLLVADLHSLTPNTFDNKDFVANKRAIVATYLAAGLDPNKACLFYQSSIKSIPLLSHILLCQTALGELERMTQFKDKATKAVKMANNTQLIPTGLLTYPTLMAADILIFNSNIVPVGQDQKQHLELTRVLAERFNKRYGETFTVPEVYIPPIGAKIMDLLDPSIKMSKSNPNPKGTIFLSDEPATIIKKIKGAVTDSLNKVHYDQENQPGISNLMTIYACLTNMSYEAIEQKYDGMNYGVFKTDLANLVSEYISKIQSKINDWLKSDDLDIIIDNSSKKANQVAEQTIDLALKNMKFI